MKRILVNSFACSPHWGSEVGMGWHWVKGLSDHHELIVLTESEWEQYHVGAYSNITFVYIPMSTKGKKLFWEGNSYFFYYYYALWQIKAFFIAREILKDQAVDIIHQLNMIGFREPGFLWALGGKHKFVYGPVGGIDLFPKGYNSVFGKNKFALLKAFLKNQITLFQFNTSIRFRLAIKYSDVVLAATSFGYKNLSTKFQRSNIIRLPETGAGQISVEELPEERNIDIIWVGRMEDRKALPILLDALSRINDCILNVEIIGKGQMLEDWTEYSASLRLKHNLIWSTYLPNQEVQAKMRRSKILAFTSLREGTPHVVSEAIANGCYILCHNIGANEDLCKGANASIFDLNSYSSSVNFFMEEIVRILKVYDGIDLKSEPFLSWNFLLNKMNEIYQENL
jgi:glycosyltransferase involved in cell wall biosynthesis